MWAIGTEIEVWGPVAAGGGALLSLIVQRAITMLTAKLKNHPTTVEELEAQLEKQKAEKAAAREELKALVREVLSEFLAAPVANSESTTSQQDLSPAMSEATASMLVRELKRANDRAEGVLPGG